ncbi:MAG: chorismate mutase [Bacteroidia bacterium]
MNFSELNTWLSIENEPLIIAGPCGAESEEQVFTIAEQLSKIPQVSLFRAGIWKPRTRPNTFEGRGEEGLKWLKEAKEKFGLKTTVEVANANHVELALKYGVDVLWIGARTTVNPFSVQEIADALKGNNIPVMVKNPIHQDLQLWIGAIERIYQAGINKIAAIHRGFFHYGSKKYRNEPFWQIPIELKTNFPDLPIICDVSHISGNRDLIQEVSQYALNINMSGLMIETHHQPDKALSDAQQQITPETLKGIIGSLQIRQSASGNNDNKDLMLELRKMIDKIDLDLLDLIKERENVIQQIGKYKKENSISVFQLERWQEILKTRSQWADKLNISRKHVEKLCQLLHEESIRIQNNI